MLGCARGPTLLHPQRLGAPPPRASGLAPPPPHQRPGSSSSSTGRAHLHRSPSSILLRQSSLSPLGSSSSADRAHRHRSSLLIASRTIGPPSRIREGERIHEFPHSPSHPDRCARCMRTLLEALQCLSSVHFAHAGHDTVPAGDSLSRGTYQLGRTYG
jgi:hypothetical protein